MKEYIKGAASLAALASFGIALVVMAVLVCVVLAPVALLSFAAAFVTIFPVSLAVLWLIKRKVQKSESFKEFVQALEEKLKAAKESGDDKVSFRWETKGDSVEEALVNDALDAVLKRNVRHCK